MPRGPAWAKGYAASLAPEHADRAREANERALELLPGRTDLTYNLLLATARAGEIGRVEELLERLELLGAEPGVVDRGRELLLQLAAVENLSEALTRRLYESYAEP